MKNKTNPNKLEIEIDFKIKFNSRLFKFKASWNQLIFLVTFVAIKIIIILI